MRISFCVVLLLTIAHVCLAAEPPTDRPKPKPMVKGVRPDVPEWHDRYDLPWEVAPAEINFADPKIHAMLLRADAAARKIAKPEWQQRAGKAYRYLSWNSGTDGYNRMYMGKWEANGPPRHSISLRTTLYQGSRAGGFELGAMYEPAGGWQSSLGYAAHGGPASTAYFNLALFHPTLTSGKSFGDPNVGLPVAPGTTQFATRRRDGRFDVRVLVYNSLYDERGGLRRATVEEIANYWESPESFRDAALVEYDRLAENCRKQIESGAALDYWTLGGPTGADVPMPAGPDKEADKELKLDILREAMEYVNERKALIVEHHEAMHRSATLAFEPLVEVIADEEK